MSKPILSPACCLSKVLQLTGWAMLIIALLSLPSLAQGQLPADYEQDRQRAFQLIDEKKLMDALPLLEKLAAAKPDDRVVLERLGLVLVAKSITSKDADERKKIRLRAREVLLRAKQLGDNSNLLQTLLDGLPEDGSDSTFSGRKEIDDVMREGEDAFAHGNLDQAIAAYKHAMQLDPKLYEAPLFLGDVYFKQGDTTKAGEWYAQAIAINPNRETAYRYWGDALVKAGRMDEARIKFLSAIVAEPYNRTPYRGLAQWAEKQQVKLAHPQIEPVGGMSRDGNKVDINVAPESMNARDGTQHWMLYWIARAAWPTARFAKAYPNEKTYRHSLAEEADAMRTAAEAAAKDIKAGKIKSINPQIATLVKLNEEGLLEAYILLAKPDAGIAQDYDEYRAKNRDKLMRYLTEYVAPAKP